MISVNSDHNYVGDSETHLWNWPILDPLIWKAVWATPATGNGCSFLLRNPQASISTCTSDSNRCFHWTAPPHLCLSHQALKEDHNYLVRTTALCLLERKSTQLDEWDDASTWKVMVLHQLILPSLNISRRPHTQLHTWQRVSIPKVNIDHQYEGHTKAHAHGRICGLSATTNSPVDTLYMYSFFRLRFYKLPMVLCATDSVRMENENPALCEWPEEETSGR